MSQGSKKIRNAKLVEIGSSFVLAGAEERIFSKGGPNKKKNVKGNTNEHINACLTLLSKRQNNTDF